MEPFRLLLHSRAPKHAETRASGKGLEAAAAARWVKSDMAETETEEM